MPQLVPIYFVNQVVYCFIFISIITYLFSKYFLPLFIRLFVTRIFITKL